MSGLLIPGRLWLGDGRIAEWMRIEGDTIAEVGPPVPVATGRFVMPGFIDTHVHLMLTGLGMQAVALQDATSPEAVWDLMRSAPAGSWARGFGFDESRFSKPLTARGLRDDRPCFVERIDHHSAIVNRLGAEALVAAGIDVDEASGRVAGPSFTRALATVYGQIDEATKVAALHAAAQAALAQGITTLHALEGGLGFDHHDLELAVAHADGRLGPRLVVYPQVGDVDFVRSLGLPRLGGCIWLDGSFGSRTAALGEPYHDAPATRGSLYFTDTVLGEFVQRVHDAGLQLAFHAIGDAAVSQVVRAYAALGDEVAERRHRIEHCELARPEDLDTIARLGIHLGVQPAFEALWGGPGKMYEQRLGVSRAERTNPIGSYHRHGIRCGGGSDSDVTPLNALAGVQAAMLHPREDQRLSVDQALTLFTSQAAALAHEEHRVGTLTPGKRADFVVLDRDPHDVAPHEVSAIRVLEVWRDGRQIFPR